LSQDPVFIALGGQQIAQLGGASQSKLLANPQSLNSYSYAQDNPITSKDPTGLDQYFNTSGQLVFSIS
jgi:hypothetical protein